MKKIMFYPEMMFSAGRDVKKHTNNHFKTIKYVNPVLDKHIGFKDEETDEVIEYEVDTKKRGEQR